MRDAPQTFADVGLPGVGSYCWRIEDGAAVWSDALLRLLGRERPPDEAGGPALCVHPEDRARVATETAALLRRGDAFEREFRILRPDGAVRVIHDRGTVERAADGRALVVHGAAFDVTRHRAERAVDRRGLEHAGVALYEYDVAQNLSYWSPTLRRLLCMSQSAAIDPKDMARDIVFGDDLPKFLSDMDAACHTVGTFELEYRVHTDRGVRWMFDSGETFGPIDPDTGMVRIVCGVLTDITDRKQAEARLQAAADTFRRLVERSPFGVYTVDDALRIAHVSDGAKAAFEKVSPLVGRDLGEALRILWPEPFVAAAVANFRRTLETGEPYNAPPLVERRRDLGRIEAYDWKIERITLPDGRYGVVCHFYDLSEREAQECALRDALTRLELAYDASAMGAWDVDLIEDSAVWSPQLFPLLGLSPDTPASPAAFFERLHPDDREGLVAAYRSAAATGDTFEAEFRIVRPDGEVRDIAGRGRVVEWRDGAAARMIGVNYDITERKTSERRLRDNEANLRRILDRNIAFTGLLDAQGVLREANAPALKAAGLTREDVIGRPFNETFWWTHDDKVVARLTDAITQALAGETVRYDETVRMGGDARIVIDFMLAPIVGPNGETEQIVASAFDITERQRATARVKMLMAEINHRSKNLLTLVQIIARRSREGDPDAFLSRFEHRIQSLAAAQDLLVRDASDSVPLNDLVRSQLSHFEDVLDTRVRIEGPPVRVMADGIQEIGMVFHELATNAGKYGALSNADGVVDLCWTLSQTPQGGEVLSIRWRERDGPPVRKPERTGFGSVVTQKLLQTTLGAEVAVEYAEDGLVWSARCTRNFVTGD